MGIARGCAVGGNRIARPLTTSGFGPSASDVSLHSSPFPSPPTFPFLRLHLQPPAFFVRAFVVSPAPSVEETRVYPHPGLNPTPPSPLQSSIVNRKSPQPSRRAHDVLILHPDSGSVAPVHALRTLSAAIDTVNWTGERVRFRLREQTPSPPALPLQTLAPNALNQTPAITP